MQSIRHSKYVYALERQSDKFGYTNLEKEDVDFIEIKNKKNNAHTFQRHSTPLFKEHFQITKIKRKVLNVLNRRAHTAQQQQQQKKQIIKI